MKAIPNFYKGKIKWEGSDKKSLKLIFGPVIFAKKSNAEGDLIKERTMVLEIVVETTVSWYGVGKANFLQRKDKMGGI